MHSVIHLGGRCEIYSRTNRRILSRRRNIESSFGRTNRPTGGQSEMPWPRSGYRLLPKTNVALAGQTGCPSNSVIFQGANDSLLQVCSLEREAMASSSGLSLESVQARARSKGKA